MKRSFENLSQTLFDVLVVGGGIHGCAIAWQAAARGLRVALVDQGDFSGAVSANSLKIIHGGFRYLQHLDLRRMRESIRARRTLLRLAPHLVHPLPCMMPTHGLGLRSRPVMGAALLANAMIGWDRNRGLVPEQQIPAGRLVSRALAANMAPGLTVAGATGAATWFDALAENTERLTLTFALSAAERGARVVNYARLLSLLTANGVVTGARVEDVLSGTSAEVRARTVVLAAGPWLESLLAAAWPRHGLRMPPLVKAWNIVLRRRLFETYAVGSETRGAFGRRNLFLAPWREGTIAGTVYEPWTVAPGPCEVEASAIQQFLDEINGLLPSARLTLNDVSLVHAGLLPALPGSGVDPARKSLWVDAGRRGGPKGLIVTGSVKYTTAPDDAEQTVDLVERALGRVPHRPEQAVLHGGNRTVCEADILKQGAESGIPLNAATARHLTMYGTHYPAILELAAGNRAFADRVTLHQPVLKAEVVAAVRDEMAQHLSDVVLRRTDLGNFAFPGHEALRTCATLMAGELGWDEARIAREVDDVMTEYRNVPYPLA